MTTDKGRKADGKFKKGVSGNPSGRPKTAKLTQADKNELKKLIKLNDPQVIFEFLIERSNDISDVMRFTREFAGYLWPKLSSTKSEVKEDRTITLKWTGVAGDILANKEPLIIENDTTTITGDKSVNTTGDIDDLKGKDRVELQQELFGE